jgi:hypothetical protein
VLSPTWVSICWQILTKGSLNELELEVTEDSFMALSGSEDIGGKKLRMGQTRFLLWKRLMERWDWGEARVILEWEGCEDMKDSSPLKAMG